MWLKVNPKVGIWGCQSQLDNSYKLWFTIADPKPQEIKVQELPEDLGRAILGALRTQTLIETNQQGEPITVSTSGQATTKAEASVDPVYETEAKKLLNGTVASVRREIAMCANQTLLNTALALEKADKDRKIVAEVIEHQLAKIKSWSKRSGPRSQYDLLIEEEEGETISFGRQAMSVNDEELSVEEEEEISQRIDRA